MWLLYYTYYYQPTHTSFFYLISTGWILTWGTAQAHAILAWLASQHCQTSWFTLQLRSKSALHFYCFQSELNSLRHFLSKIWKQLDRGLYHLNPLPKSRDAKMTQSLQNISIMVSLTQIIHSQKKQKWQYKSSSNFTTSCVCTVTTSISVLYVLLAITFISRHLRLVSVTYYILRTGYQIFFSY